MHARTARQSGRQRNGMKASQERSLRDRTAKLARAPKGKLGDIIYTRLKELIVSCEFRPGEELTEARLAARLNVGKAPVRFALVRLQQERLVASIPRQGYVVSSLSLQDIEDIYQLRMVLEPLAVGLAAQRISADSLKQLGALSSVDYAAGDRLGENRFLKSNRLFHNIIAEQCGNERLAQLIGQLHDNVARILALCISEHPNRWDLGHKAIVAALSKGDAEQAASLQRTELEKSRASVLQAALRASHLMTMNLSAK